MCDLEAIGAPSIFRLLCSAAALARILPTLLLSWLTILLLSGFSFRERVFFRKTKKSTETLSFLVKKEGNDVTTVDDVGWV